MLKSKLFWSRYVELLLAFLGFGWLIAEPSWEPLIVVLGSIAAFVYCEIDFIANLPSGGSTQIGAPVKGQQLEDGKLYERLTNLLPSNGIINFIDKHDMAGSFDLDVLDPLDEFIHTWKNAEHEFLDPEIENAKSEFYDRCREFSLNRFPRSGSGNNLKSTEKPLMNSTTRQRKSLPLTNAWCEWHVGGFTYRPSAPVGA